MCRLRNVGHFVLVSMCLRPHISPLWASYEAWQLRSLLLTWVNLLCWKVIISNTYIYDIKNNAWVTVNNDFLSRVRRFGNDFHEWRSHEWKSLPNRLTSDKKIVIHGNECIILFLTRYFMSWTHKYAKNYHRALISPLLPRRPFLTEHCDVTTIDLWRHANAKYWYCDVIFVYCHCTRKLAQRRSSLVNNSREYRYLATRYSRLSV